MTPVDTAKILSDQQKTLRDEISARIGFENTLLNYIWLLIGAATTGAILLTNGTDPNRFVLSAIVFLVLPIGTTPFSLLILHHERVIGRIRDHLEKTWKPAMEGLLESSILPLQTDFDGSRNRFRWSLGLHCFLLAPFAVAIGAVVRLGSPTLHAYCGGSFQTWIVWSATIADLAALIILLVAICRQDNNITRRN